MSYGIIAKTNGRNKVIDFRDGLVPARPDNYAMIHGKGGKDHAPISVIKIAVCDYSAGSGNSTTLFANIAPDVCEQIFEVCKRNVGTIVIDDNLLIFQELRAANKKLLKTADMQFNALNNILSVLNRIEKAEKVPGLTAIASGLGTLLGKPRDKVMAAAEEPARPACMTMATHTDFNHSQDRVHAQKKDAQGYAPVQRLNIFHTTYRKDGQLGNYSWTVKITNARAKVRVQPTGATTYDASSMKDVKGVFIQVSDADMFRMMSQVNRFIRVWEFAMAADLVRSGEAAREKERKEYLASRKAEDADDVGEIAEPEVA